MEKENKSKKEINDEQLEEVSGGMEIKPIKSPKEMEPILNMIFRVKKEQD